MDPNKAAAEARKQKIRNLEFSLFGEKQNDGIVGLPSIKSVDEYNERYGSVYNKDANIEKSRNNMATPNTFYNEPKKRVKIASPVDDAKKYAGATDEGNQNQSQATGSDPAVGWASGKRNSRPKTSTQRLDDILSDDLRNFGSRLSTPIITSEEIQHNRGANHLRGQHHLLDELDSDYHDPSHRLIQVNQNSEERGRATLLGQKTDIVSGSSMIRRDADSRTKVDSFLEQEQDELAMSLSQSKFLMLRNANLERVKADEKSPDLDEMKHLEKIKSRLHLSNLTGTEEISESVPEDTFKDIPDDVFEKIPRAVTARIQNRERKKLRSSSGRPSAPEPVCDYSSQPTPSAPLAEGEVPGQSVGFIAMLFSGGSGARPGNIEQIEQDFMFALFLQKQEEESGESRERRPEPRDPSLGHFCAPDLPGFCEANFCIFHSKK